MRNNSELPAFLYFYLFYILDNENEDFDRHW